MIRLKIRTAAPAKPRAYTFLDKGLVAPGPPKPAAPKSAAMEELQKQVRVLRQDLDRSTADVDKAVQ